MELKKRKEINKGQTTYKHCLNNEQPGLDKIFNKLTGPTAITII